MPANRRCQNAANTTVSGAERIKTLVNTMCFGGFHENVAKMKVLDPYHAGGDRCAQGRSHIYSLNPCVLYQFICNIDLQYLAFLISEWHQPPATASLSARTNS